MSALSPRLRFAGGGGETYSSGQEGLALALQVQSLFDIIFLPHGEVVLSIPWFIIDSTVVCNSVLNDPAAHQAHCVRCAQLCWTNTR